jgi:DNA polymerase-3 subunit beta
VRARLHQATAHSDFGAFDHSCSPDPNTEAITIMEIVVHTTDFARVFRLLQTLADRKNTMPVLCTLLIRADAKGLTITGTDTDLGGICYCPAAIQAPGSAAIPAQRLTEYVRMLPDGELVLKAQTSGWLSLSCGRSRSRIATISAESFPELPKPARDGTSLSCGVLARLIEKASVAVSSESVHTNLAGALLKIETSMVSMVATDGHRLALATAPVAMPALKEPVEILIPRKALAAFLRFAEGRNDQPVRCAVTDNHVFFVWQERLLFSRKLTGTFPSNERVLPKSHAASRSLNRNDLRSALERVAQFTESKTRCVVVEVSTNQFCVRAQDRAVGEGEESLVISYAGEPARIGFNAAYLADFLNRAEHQNVPGSRKSSFE